MIFKESNFPKFKGSKYLIYLLKSIDKVLSIGVFLPFIIIVLNKHIVHGPEFINIWTFNFVYYSTIIYNMAIALFIGIFIGIMASGNAKHSNVVFISVLITVCAIAALIIYIILAFYSWIYSLI